MKEKSVKVMGKTAGSRLTAGGDLFLPVLVPQ